MKAWPGAGNVKDLTLIADFTGESAEKIGGFPVNSPDCMVQDQNVNNIWMNLVGGLYDTFNKRKPSLQTMGGFYNDINSPFENLSQEKSLEINALYDTDFPSLTLSISLFNMYTICPTSNSLCIMGQATPGVPPVQTCKVT